MPSLKVWQHALMHYILSISQCLPYSVVYVFEKTRLRFRAFVNYKMYRPMLTRIRKNRR